MLEDGSDAALAGDHRRLDRGEWTNVYVVGDVHGCPAELRDLLDALDPAADELVAFVGDLVRKGPDSRSVLDILDERPNYVSVRGNNEQKLIEGTHSAGLDDAGRAALEGLPAALSWEGGLVVHGGLDPHRPLGDHEPEEVLTMRAPHGDGYAGPLWYEAYEGPPRVFFGHTVLDAPLDRRWAVGLDTGCVYGGALTAYDTGRDRFVSVPARRTYQERDTWLSVPPEGRAEPHIPAAVER